LQERVKGACWWCSTRRKRADLQIETSAFDRAAVGFSGLCLVHCLVLPATAAFAPFVSLIAEAQWVHWLLTLCAIAASSNVMLRDPAARRIRFVAPAGLGMVLITAALFADNIGTDETALMVAGGLLLSGAHLLRLIKHREAVHPASYDEGGASPSS